MMFQESALPHIGQNNLCKSFYQLIFYPSRLTQEAVFQLEWFEAEEFK